MELSTKLIDYKGQPAVLAISRDISQRKKVENELKEREEQLRQAQKMEAVGRLAGGIAHDFNNLLTVINGYTDMLLHQLQGDESGLLSDLLEINAAGNRAAALTQQLLAFSRKQVLQFEVIGLNRLIAGMEEMLRRLLIETRNRDVSEEQTADHVDLKPGRTPSRCARPTCSRSSRS